MFKNSRGTSLRAWFQCTRLRHRTCKTSRGTSLRSWFQKKCLLPMGILVFFLSKIPPILNLELDFFPLKHVFEIFWPNTVNYRSINYLWPKFQKIFGTFFFRKNPTFSKKKVGFFSEKKSFSQIFQNTAYLFYLNFISKKKNQKIREHFLVGREVGREGGR